MPLQLLPILSGLGRSDVVKFVLHLAETVKWGLQPGFLLAGKQLLGSRWAGWQATDFRAGVGEPLTHPFPHPLLLPEPSTRIPRPGTHLSLTGFSILTGNTRDRPQVDDQDQSPLPSPCSSSLESSRPRTRDRGAMSRPFYPPLPGQSCFSALPHMHLPVYLCPNCLLLVLSIPPRALGAEMLICPTAAQ